ncbi:histidine phosphatase family protein [Sporosarcina aquimarina]|uniref:Histidine phosphatase family protein n=1 Tax=Sporosarcina aquimarina TaxID=114975 RepID=A0ABU4G2N0_9BACL|nr:histidine phosphatase family protein [Sporosarcina aquimarina]MDW0110612.1 histidine phosphatase family protein [Sporosarcina aquimarina]
MTTVGFVRHGVTAWNKQGRAQGSTDIPLDEEGIRMAVRVADRLAADGWDAIYTSPWKRAKRTAELIGEKISNADVMEDTRIRERAGGLIEGTTEADRRAKWGPEWKQLDLQGETHDSVITRGMSFIEEMQQRYPEGRVLAVSHGGFIKRLLSELLPGTTYEEPLGNTSLTIVKLDAEQNVCELFNCTEHLHEMKL